MSQIKIKQIEGLQALLDTLIAGVTSGSLKSVYTQANHGFAAGVAVSFNDTTATWVLADATSEDTLGRVIVESVPSANTFIGVQVGNVSVSTWNLTPGKFYVVDNSGTGVLTEFTTNDAYPFSNPIMQALTSTMGHVLPWRPSVGGAPLNVPISHVQQGLTPFAGTGNYQPTGITLDFNPFETGGVSVLVNGMAASEGYGTRNYECYFSNDGGVTAKAVDALAVGDELYWNGNIAGFDLAVSDSIDLEYQKSSLD